MNINPNSWTLKLYLWVILGLLGINLLGPRGLIHFVVIHQEAERLSTELSRVTLEKEKTQNAINDFKNSQQYKEYLIRERLGYLKKDEILIKFVQSEQK